MRLDDLQRVLELKRALKETDERIAVCKGWMNSDKPAHDPFLMIGNVPVMFARAVSDADIFVELVEMTLSSLEAYREELAYDLTMLGIDDAGDHVTVTFDITGDLYTFVKKATVNHNVLVREVRHAGGTYWKITVTCPNTQSARELGCDLYDCTDDQLEDHTFVLEGMK